MRRCLASLAGRAEKSRTLCQHLAAHPAYRAAKTVALFDAMAAEPQVEMLWSLAPRRFLYPRVDGTELLLHEVESPEALIAASAAARYREPALNSAAILPPDQVDLVVVPGLAFTRAGYRLGRGGGHYDRLLARLRPGAGKLGVCFEVQLADELPVEAHDMRMSAVVTEAGVYEDRAELHAKVE